jgi:hypothetical protein
MKLRVVIDLDVSNTIAETMKRTGFTVLPDGSAMKIQVPNAPTIPKRKVKIVFEDKAVPKDTPPLASK